MVRSEKSQLENVQVGLKKSKDTTSSLSADHQNFSWQSCKTLAGYSKGVLHPLKTIE